MSLITPVLFLLSHVKMPALITECTGTSLVKISVVIFNLDVSYLHAAKAKKRKRFTFFKKMCVWLCCKRDFWVTVSALTEKKKDQTSSFVSFTVVHKMECIFFFFFEMSGKVTKPTLKCNFNVKAPFTKVDIWCSAELLSCNFWCDDKNVFIRGLFQRLL